MFSCRLTPEDAAYLQEFLALADTECIYPQDSFRYLLRELHNRLYRNWLGYLKLKAGKHELNDEELLEANRILDKARAY